MVNQVVADWSGDDRSTHGVEKKDLETTVHVETSYAQYGLRLEDATFLANFGEERRKKVLRKVSCFCLPAKLRLTIKQLDWRLVPMLALLYLIAYIDRANIGTAFKYVLEVSLKQLGNAKIEGLTEDLNLSGTEYNIALSIFFIPYILLGMNIVH